MADRDIHIPFGPDKTGGMGMAALGVQDAESADGEALPDPFAEPPASAYADADESFPEVRDARVDELPEALERDAADGVESGKYQAGGMSDDEAIAQGYDDMQMSFMALRDSVGQGRELKAREKEIKELQEKLDVDNEELSDRENILANYQALVDEQDRVIAQHTEQRESRKAELARVVADLTEATEALTRMKEYHTSEMQPLETELGRARASAEQARNDERSRKSELNAAESELRRAGSSDDSTMASAKHRQVKAAYEDAKAHSEKAKETLAEVQRVYDDAIQQIEQSEGPLERSIEDLKHREEELKESVNRLGGEISTARKRRQYCDSVYQYPDETAKLRSRVDADEQTVREMIAENDELRDQLAQSREKAKKAKLALGIVAVIIVVFIVALIIVLTRS